MRRAAAILARTERRLAKRVAELDCQRRARRVPSILAARRLEGADHLAARFILTAILGMSLTAVADARALRGRANVGAQHGRERSALDETNRVAAVEVVASRCRIRRAAIALPGARPQDRRSLQPVLDRSAHLCMCQSRYHHEPDQNLSKDAHPTPRN